MANAELPEPLSDQLIELVAGARQQAVYGLLFRRRESPPTEVEISYFLADVAGEGSPSIASIIESLEEHFLIERIPGGSTRFRLESWRPAEVGSIAQAIGLSLRSEVLAAQRCAQCGRTPLEDQVRLMPSQRIPIAWGGTASRENLEPLCEECAVGRQQYFAKWDHVADKIRGAADRDDPRERLGELLRAMSPEWVRADLLEAVASAKEYQDDWQRRLRDLRFIGWDYEHENRRTEGARTWAYYRLKKTAPWPSNIHAAITTEAARRKRERSRKLADSARD